MILKRSAETSAAALRERAAVARERAQRLQAEAEAARRAATSAAVGHLE